MTYQLPYGYEVIPVAPHAAQVVPTRYPPPAPAPPSPPEKQNPPLFALLVIGVIVWVLINGNVNQSRSSALEQRNAQLTQENLLLRNRIDQLNHQLMGLYSAPQRP